MEASDKIYIEIRHPFGNEFTEMIGFENRGNSEDIEYIRKDALLEWARKKNKRIDTDEGDYSLGYVSAMIDLIDKLNSM